MRVWEGPYCRKTVKIDKAEEMGAEVNYSIKDFNKLTINNSTNISNNLNISALHYHCNPHRSTLIWVLQRALSEMGMA